MAFITLAAQRVLRVLFFPCGLFNPLLGVSDTRECRAWVSDANRGVVYWQNFSGVPCRTYSMLLKKQPQNPC